MGLFGILFTLASGGAYIYKDITESRENEEARQRAIREGKKYYHAVDGERAVDTNHRITRLPNGIKDYETGKWLYDKKKEDAKERAKLSELDEISKKEAIIKGEKTYWCTLHESDPRRHGKSMIGDTRYRRLVSNNMPVKQIKRDFLVDGSIENKIYYTIAIESREHFQIPLYYEDYDSETNEKIYNNCYKWNMNFVMKSICEVYPINEVEVIYKYCKKYDIPLGTWDNIEAMMLEEHPLGWRKVPPSKDWQYEQFMERFLF